MMFRSAALLVLTLTASTNARINHVMNIKDNNNQSDTSKEAAATMDRKLHPLHRHLAAAAVQRAALLGHRFDDEATGGTAAAGGGDFLDNLLAGDNGDSLLGGEHANGQLQQFLASILAEAEFPQDLLNGDGNGDGMNGMIAELLQVIMSMVQGGGVGNGIMNPENGLLTMLSEWLDALQMTDLGCGGQDQSALPECAWNLQGDAGVWVCRSIYNPETGVLVRESINTCAHPQLSFATLDQCGACPVEANAPEIVQCTCPCTTNNGDTGVGINVMGSFMERCYAAGIVNTVVNNMPFVECATC